MRSKVFLVTAPGLAGRAETCLQKTLNTVRWAGNNGTNRLRRALIKYVMKMGEKEVPFKRGFRGFCMCGLGITYFKWMEQPRIKGSTFTSELSDLC